MTREWSLAVFESVRAAMGVMASGVTSEADTAEVEAAKGSVDDRATFGACRVIHRETRALINELLRKSDQLSASGASLPHRYDFIREAELPKEPRSGRSPVENVIGFVKGVACATLVLGAVMAGLEPTTFARSLLLVGAAVMTLIAGNALGKYVKRLIAWHRDDQLIERHRASEEQWLRYAEAVDAWEQQRAKLGQSTAIPALSMRDLEAVSNLLARTEGAAQRQVIEALLADFAERALNARNLELTDTAAMKLSRWAKGSRVLDPVVDLACLAERLRDGEHHLLEQFEARLATLDTTLRGQLAGDLQHELMTGKAVRLPSTAKTRLVGVLAAASAAG